MHLTFSSSHTDIDQLHVQNKISSFSKYVDLSSPDVRVAVQLGKSHNNDRHADDLYRAEVRVTAGGKDYYTTAERADMHTAFDEARAEMMTVLGRAKDKQVSLARRGRNMMRKILGRFGK